MKSAHMLELLDALDRIAIAQEDIARANMRIADAAEHGYAKLSDIESAIYHLAASHRIDAPR